MKSHPSWFEDVANALDQELGNAVTYQDKPQYMQGLTVNRIHQTMSSAITLQQHDHLTTSVVAEILERYPRFDILARVAMERELSVYQEMIASFITKNAEQRYLDILENKSHLIQLIPQHQLATYLGVSPETLSRIKKRIHS